MDFMTVKPYFTIRTLLIYAGVAVFLTYASGSAYSSVSVGMMLGTMFVGYPFAVGEKSNMDALYATLSVDRKTVVLGRYLFTLALNFLAVLSSFVLASVSLLAARRFDFALETADALWAVIALAIVFAVVQSVQLPIFFKVSYSKAKFLSVVPYLAIMAGYFTVSLTGGDSIRPPEFLLKLLDNIETSLLFAAFALLIIVYVSYNLSVSFYKKREF
jgi:hypothetical protein